MADHPTNGDGVIYGGGGADSLLNDLASKPISTPTGRSSACSWSANSSDVPIRD